MVYKDQEAKPEWEFRHRGARLARLRRIQAAQAVQPDVNTAATGAGLLSALKEEIANFHQFLNSNPRIGRQLNADPLLINEPRYLDEHPGLQAYLYDHPLVNKDLREDPKPGDLCAMRQQFFRSAPGRFATSGSLLGSLLCARSVEFCRSRQILVAPHV